MKKQASIIILIIFIFLTGCSNNQKKLVFNPHEIYTYILIDDSASLENALNNGFPLSYKNSDSISLLKYAVLKNSQNSVSLLLNKGFDPDQDEIAFSIRSFNILKVFKENNFNLNQKNALNEPLLVNYIKNKPTKYSLFLIENNVNINVKDSEGWTPLFWATIMGNDSILSSLLNKGASPFDKDTKGNYPIYYAENEDKISLLLNYNYNLTEKNNEGENILGEVLLKAVANNQISTVKLLSSKGFNLNYKSYGKGAMDIALANNNLEMISFLQEKGIKK